MAATDDSGTNPARCDDPQRFNYDRDLVSKAQAWNLARFEQALKDGRSPIVVDRGNGRNEESQKYVLLADQYSYDVVLKEPESPWWQELRVLLKYQRYIDDRILDGWAQSLPPTVITRKNECSMQAPI